MDGRRNKLRCSRTVREMGRWVDGTVGWGEIIARCDSQERMGRGGEAKREREMEGERIYGSMD